MGAVLAVVLCDIAAAPPAGASPAASNSADPSDSRHEIRTGLEITRKVPATAHTAKGADSDGLSAPQAREFSNDTAPGSNEAEPRVADPAVPSPSQSMTPDECFSHSSAFSGSGWAKGRFASCQAYHVHTWKVDCFLWWCSQVGTADADMAVIHYTRNGVREVLEVTYLGNWRRQGDMSGVSLTVDSNCTVTSAIGTCSRDSAPTTRPVDAWAASGSSFLYAGFQQTGGTVPDQLADADLRWRLTAFGGENGPVTRDGPASPVRCDRASYLLYSGAGEGCAFPWAPAPTWTIDRVQSPQAALNIWEAQNTPNTTQPPSSAPKSIPGAPGAAPLHRDANDSAIRSHRGVAQRACARYFPGSYPAPNTDCDEYPFASTQEGAVNQPGGVRNYVVKPIPRKDNQDAGTSLNTFYASQRIMGSSGYNDAFHVSVP